LTRTVRRIVQIGILAFFFYLFFQTRFPLPIRIPPDSFLRFSPLLTGAEMLALRTISATIFPALILVFLTLVLGRAFCGWVCPMGTVIDASDVVLLRGRRQSRKAVRHHWKYLALLGVVGAGLFGVQVAYLLDPLSLLTRTAATVIYPVTQLAEGAFVDRFGAWLREKGFFPQPEQFLFRTNLIVLGMFVGILALGIYYRRYWCNSLCPLGGLLGAFSLATPLRIKVNEECNQCGLCVRTCKMAALVNERQEKLTECIVCFDCIHDCPQKAMKFGLDRPEARPREEFSLSRRRLLGGLGIGAVFALGANTELAQTHSNPLRIRPPGSIPEEMFIDVCVRCSQCMKACLTNGLQPAISEAGISGFWTPILVPKIGYCAQPCTLCGQVCPSGAILDFTVEEKKDIKIGLASIYRDECIAWYADQLCLVCDEHCSYKAIVWKEVEGRKRPFVDEEKCTGCGECETYCPVIPRRAIRVTARGDEESRRARLTFRRARNFPGLGLDRPPGEDKYLQALGQSNRPGKIRKRLRGSGRG
jgi:polyferredoxin